MDKYGRLSIFSAPLLQFPCVSTATGAVLRQQVVSLSLCVLRLKSLLPWLLGGYCVLDAKRSRRSSVYFGSIAPPRTGYPLPLPVNWLNYKFVVSILLYLCSICSLCLCFMADVCRTYTPLARFELPSICFNLAPLTWTCLNLLAIG